MTNMEHLELTLLKFHSETSSPRLRGDELAQNFAFDIKQTMKLYLEFYQQLGLSPDRLERICRSCHEQTAQCKIAHLINLMRTHICLNILLTT